MNKSAKIETPKKSKSTSVKHFVAAVLVLIVMISASYCAFITAVGVGGRTNIYLALPTILVIVVIILLAVYSAVANFNK